RLDGTSVVEVGHGLASHDVAENRAVPERDLDAHAEEHRRIEILGDAVRVRVTGQERTRLRYDGCVAQHRCERITRRMPAATASLVVRSITATTPSRSMIVTSLWSAPMAMSERDTSLSTIRSMPLWRSFASAFSSRSDVSAANPTTSNASRYGASRSAARMSTFGSSSSTHVPSRFLIFSGDTLAGR